MTREEAIGFVVQYVRAINAHDVSALADLYAPDATVISPTFGQIVGREAIENSYLEFFSVVFPDFVLDTDIRQMIVERRQIVLFVTMQFTHSVPLFDVPASGARVDVRTVVLVIKFRAGKIIHEHRMWDSLSVRSVLDKLQLDRELRAAADVQRALLPHRAIICDYCDLAGASLPCRMIGGDFFEHVELPSGAIGIALGDVSGKGPPAALLTSLIQGILACETEAGRPPAEMMSRINRLLLKRGIEARFATLFYCVLTSDGRMTYSNAGHNPPVLKSRQGNRLLITGGTVLGMFENAAFEEDSVELEPGDIIVCFTDGVTEATNSEGDEFGEQRLLSCLDTVRTNDPSSDVIQRVFGSVRAFCGEAPQRDDITMLTVRFLGNS
jgi:uncharacterized protein (TIGR02246 family)